MKYILLFVFIVFSGCTNYSGTNNQQKTPSIVDSEENVFEVNNEIETTTPIDISSDPNLITINSLYEKYSKNVENPNLSLEIFARIFLEFNYTENETVDLTDLKYRGIKLFEKGLLNDESFVNVLNNINTFDFSLYNASQDIFNSGISQDPQYSWDNGMLHWNYNEKINYLFSLDTAYEMIGMCNIVTGKADEFVDFRGETASLEEEITPSGFIEGRITELSSDLEEDGIYEKIISGAGQDISDEVALMSIAQEYKNNNYSSIEIENIFFKEFMERLSIETSYNDFTLYVFMELLSSDNSETTCDDLYENFFRIK